MKKILLLAFSALFFFGTKAQSPAALIQQAMSRMGAWQDAGTVKLVTTQKNYNKWQNYNFFQPRANPNSAFWFFDLKNRQYYYKTEARYGGGYQFVFVSIGKDSTRYTYDVIGSRNGREGTKTDKQGYLGGFNQLNQYLPYYQLKAVLDSKDSLSQRQEGDLIVLQRQTRSGAVEQYFFNKDNLFLQNIRSVNGNTKINRVFGSYKMYSGLWYPVTTDVFINGDLNTADKVTAITINEPLPPSLLQLPPTYSFQPQTTPPMEVKEIEKDVFLIRNIPGAGGRNLIFRTMDDYIFVTEAPINSEVTQTVIDLIHKTVPNKPIKYVHISHFHNDHSNGVRAFVAEGTTIVATAPTIEALKTIINDTTGGFKDRLALKRVNPSYEVFSKKRVIEDAHHKIELHEMKTGHAQGMSFVYLPDAGIIYEGDLYTLPDDETVTPAIEITRDFYSCLKKNKITPKRIIGHHGHSNITMEVLQKAVALKGEKKTGIAHKR